MLTFATIERGCTRNSFYLAAVGSLPGFVNAYDVATQAAQLMNTDRDAVQPDLLSPIESGKITETWLKAAADTRLQAAEHQVRQTLLREVMDTARGECESLVVTSTDEILTRLHASLLELLVDVTALVGRLEGARTAEDAVRFRVADAWADLEPLVSQYDELRVAQRMVMADHPDRVMAGKPNHYPGFDPHATDLAVRNLDEIWPQRDFGTDFNPESRLLAAEGRSEPWPTNPVEAIVWMINHHAQLWVPTLAELDDLRGERIQIRSEHAGKPRIEKPIETVFAPTDRPIRSAAAVKRQRAEYRQLTGGTMKGTG